MFFHFVGATPGSTDLAFFLQRLSREINVSKVKRPFRDFPLIAVQNFKATRKKTTLKGILFEFLLCYVLNVSA